MIIAPAKGQPKHAPMAIQKIPWAVRRPPRQSMKAAMLSITKYIAKLDGRYEMLAWKKPGEVAVIII